MRIYTRTGDHGETGLYGSARVRKNDARVEAYGEVDELNAALGMALAAEPFADLREVLGRLQRELFVLGADLASSSTGEVGGRAVPRVTAAMVAALEADIDRFESRLTPLENFILPGGTLAAAALHLARCVARRAERRVVALSVAEPVGEPVLPYLNRLSDLLFVLARAANEHAGESEAEWLGLEEPAP